MDNTHPLEEALEDENASFGWQVWASALVALGCLAPVAYAAIDTFWS